MSRVSLSIAIGQAKTEPWESIWREGQVPTWVQRFRKEVEIINASGLPMSKFGEKYDAIHEKVRYQKAIGRWQGRLDYLWVPWLNRNIAQAHELPATTIREIQIKTSSSYLFAGRRLLGVISWFLKEDKSDFLFTTTTSSLVNVPLLYRQISKFDPRESIYAGHLLGEEPHQFVSGAGTLLSRGAAGLIVKNFKKYPQEMLNDAALGKLMRTLGIHPICHPWIWIQKPEEIEKLSVEVLAKTFHYRCKTSTFPRIDALIMKKLHTRLEILSQQGKIHY